MRAVQIRNAGALAFDTFTRATEGMVDQIVRAGQARGVEVWVRRNEDGGGSIAFNKVASKRMAHFIGTIQALPCDLALDLGDGWEPLAVIPGVESHGPSNDSGVAV